MAKNLSRLQVNNLKKENKAFLIRKIDALMDDNKELIENFENYKNAVNEQTKLLSAMSIELYKKDSGNEIFDYLEESTITAIKESISDDNA